MFRFLRIFLLVAAATLFGAAQAACACAPYVSMAYHPAAEQNTEHSAHQRDGTSHDNHHMANPSSHCDGKESAPCAFHAAHELAAASVAPASTAVLASSVHYATLAPTGVFPEPEHRRQTGSLSVRWLPPPGQTPVSMKVRLLN